MALAFKVGTSASTTATGATLTTASVDSSGGDFIYVGMGGIINTTHSASDNKSNTYTHNFNPVTSGGSGPEFLSSDYMKAPTVGTGHTFTMTSGSSSDIISLTVQVWSGTDQTAPADQHNENSYTSTTTPTSNATPTTSQADEVVIGCVTNDGASADTFVAGSGFTLPAACKQDANTSIVQIASEYKIVAATGTYTSSFSTAPNNEAGVILVSTYKQATAGGFTAKFRKTLSGIGTKVGSKQISGGLKLGLRYSPV